MALQLHGDGWAAASHATRQPRCLDGPARRLALPVPAPEDSGRAETMARRGRDPKVRASCVSTAIDQAVEADG